MPTFRFGSARRWPGSARTAGRSRRSGDPEAGRAVPHDRWRDALIGADGIRSTVRARLAGGGVGHAAGNRADRLAGARRRRRARIAAAGRRDRALARPQRPSRSLPGGRLRPARQSCRDHARVKTRRATRTRPGRSRATPQIIKARFAGWHASARELIAAATAWTTWPLFDRAPLPPGTPGPIALLGDAAHPILPFLAQGAAQAIEDAAALAAAFASTRNPPPTRSTRLFARSDCPGDAACRRLAAAWAHLPSRRPGRRGSQCRHAARRRQTVFFPATIGCIGAVIHSGSPLT